MSSEPLTALIVDDEPAARRDLEQVLTAIEGVKIVGQASDAAAARHLARRLTPSLIFMDIQLPGADGFQVLEEIDTALCCVIFTTAYSQFALRAFDVGAIDYLLKPVEEERCRRAVERARDNLQRTGVPTDTPKVEIEERGEHVLIPMDDIQVVTTDGNYLEIRHRHGRGIVRQTLEGFLAQPPGGEFLRVNRKQAVRPAFIRAHSGNTQSGLRLVLQDGGELPVSRRRAAEVMAQLRASGQSQG